ncbi:MAG: hypothetical protein QM757_18285, partial [Paludibaculum sp.]
MIDERIRQVEAPGFSVETPALWQQPIYRNVFGLLRDFGDTEFKALLGARLSPLPTAKPVADGVEPEIHMRQQVRELVEYTQHLVAASENVRAERWKTAEVLFGFYRVSLLTLANTNRTKYRAVLRL